MPVGRRVDLDDAGHVRVVDVHGDLEPDPAPVGHRQQLVDDVQPAARRPRRSPRRTPRSTARSAAPRRRAACGTASTQPLAGDVEGDLAAVDRDLLDRARRDRRARPAPRPARRRTRRTSRRRAARPGRARSRAAAGRRSRRCRRSRGRRTCPGGRGPGPGGCRPPGSCPSRAGRRLLGAAPARAGVAPPACCAAWSGPLRSAEDCAPPVGSAVSLLVPAAFSSLIGCLLARARPAPGARSARPGPSPARAACPSGRT